MSERPSADALFEHWVERHVVHGTRLDLDVLCADAPGLREELARRIARYDAIDRVLDAGPGTSRPTTPGRAHARAADDGGGALPAFAGFRTIERIGRGGMGDVYKLEDTRLHRLVAAKVVRADAALAGPLDAFLREARSLALFDDPRIVRIHEFRPRGETSRPVIIMEHVDGFPLLEVAPSLDFAQRARLMAEVADAVHHAHALGLTHRDLKPGNILLDKRLQPKILDFGLADRDPRRGHGEGTLQYFAPEQLDPSRQIDARTDVHALGVILYELLCGARPYTGETENDVLQALREGRPRLPVEIAVDVPEPLQAVALQAMEPDPARRYPSAREMALDLRRHLAGRPVLARPTLYAAALEQRIAPHLEQVEEWLRLRLIHAHEALRLKLAYAQMKSREDDWIVDSRSLSFSQIALYLGAFLVACAGLLLFAAWRIEATTQGLAGPLLAMALPLAVLTLAAERLARAERRAVSVALHLAGVILVPLFLVLLLSDRGWLAAAGDAKWQVLGDLDISNRQLQVAIDGGLRVVALARAAHAHGGAQLHPHAAARHRIPVRCG